MKSFPDHFPLLLTMHKSPPVQITPRFNIESCESLVSSHWSIPVHGSPMFILHQKLKSLKPKLKHWNKTEVGNFHHNVDLAHQQLLAAQLALDQLGFSMDRSQDELTCLTNYSQALHILNDFWKDKAKNAKFIDGDRNTAYFHRSVKIREAQNFISMLKHGDEVLTDASNIEAHVLHYFTNIFTVNPPHEVNDLPDRLIPSLVTEADNALLTSLPSAEDIKNVVMALSGDSAPGPDGYSGHFYQSYWHIIGSDVVQATQFFFTSNSIMNNLNSNLLILISKVQGADRLDNFRLIALVNFQFKIITKILADRVGIVASKIVSVHQRGFIPGRHIQDCIMTASEVVNTLHKKTYGSNIALKIDVRKAFDTLNWNFLLHVLNCFGFNQCFCNWISTILHSAKLSVSINGKAVGFFNCTRGVRQGDPFSPLLFCLAEEVVSRGLEALALVGSLTQIHASRGLLMPSHCLYADDILIFCKGTLSNIRNIIGLFEEYGNYSGQFVNASKSKFYTGSLPLSRIFTITSITGFTHGCLPFSYLGILLFKGKPRTSHLRPIFDKIKAKISAWKGKLLSIIGRVQLINSVISSMLVYSFHIYQWPSSLLSDMTKCLRNFVWSGDPDHKKICTVAWSILCKPREEGGLSVKDPRLVNRASMLHLSWKLLVSPKLIIFLPLFGLV